MSCLFRRLSDDKVEDRVMELITSSLRSDDASTQVSLSPPPGFPQSSAIRGLPAVAEFLPLSFVSRKLLPAVQCLPPYLHDNVPASPSFPVEFSETNRPVGGAGAVE